MPMFKNSFYGLLIFFCAGSFCWGADETWRLTDAQFRSASAQVLGIDAAGVHMVISEANSTPVISWDNLLQLDRDIPATSAPGNLYQIYLFNGDHLGGQPTGSAGETVQWKQDALGQINIPLSRVAGIAQSNFTPKLDEPRSDDLVQLANGDSTHGIVTNIDNTGVTIQTGDTTATLGWDSIAAVLFSNSSPTDDEHRMFRVRFADGGTISVPNVSLTGDQFTLHFDDKQNRDVPLSSVCGIEQINGPVSWLTSRKPVENVYKPYFTEQFPTRFDRTVTGLPLSERDPGFHHGIGCHAYSKLVYELTGHYAGFRTQYAIDSDSPLADVNIRILLDGQVVLEKKHIRAGENDPVVILPLGDARRLTLEVDYGQDNATQDRFIWLDPALIRQLPAAGSVP